MKTVLCEDRAWLLSEEAFSLYAPCMFQPTYEAYRSRMERLAADPAVRLFVGEAGGRRVGILALERSSSTARLLGIAVAEDCRRRGIGRSMIRGVMTSEGIGRLEAQTDGDAIAFYRKCGFSEKKVTVSYPDGVAVRYDCTLRG